MTARRLGLLALSACLWESTAAQPPNLDWIDFERLDAGEVLLETTNVSRGTVHIDLAIAIDADWQSVWDLLKACEVSPEYVPHVEACRRVAAIEECNCDIFEQTVKPAVFLPRFEHIFRLEYFPPERIEVRHVSGPIDVLEGAWTLVERPDAPMILLHSLTINPGIPVPRLFVRNSLRRDLPTVLREVRARAENPSAYSR
jgi:hypothetical protein